MIGAGIVGCAVAYELGRRGVSVTVLDDRPPGMGATQASAGMLAPYNEVDEEGGHLDLARRGLDVFDEFVARVSVDSGHAVPYRRTGTLTLAFDETARAGLARRLAFLRARSVEAELLDEAGVRREEPAAAGSVQAGLIVPSHGFVAATALTRALVSAARRHGVRFDVGPRARTIRPDRDRVVVSNGVTTYAAGHVVQAAGSWAGQVAVDGADPAPVRPVRGQLLQLRAEGPHLRRVTWGDGCYLVPWDDGSLLVGATVEEVGFDEHTTIGGIHQLMGGLAATLQRDWRAAVTGARAGLRPATPDGLPLIGTSSVAPRVMYATGHYRNGVLLAPITAELIAAALLDGRADPLLQVTRPDRFGRL